MKLPFRRSKPKSKQAADALASVAELWSDMKISKRARKAVKQGASKASSATSSVGCKARCTRTRSVAAVGLLGGAGALVARKLKSRDPEPLPYAPPPAPPMPPVPTPHASPVPPPAPPGPPPPAPPVPPPAPAADVPAEPADEQSAKDGPQAGDKP